MVGFVGGCWKEEKERTRERERERCWAVEEGNQRVGSGLGLAPCRPHPPPLSVALSLRKGPSTHPFDASSKNHNHFKGASRSIRPSGPRAAFDESPPAGLAAADWLSQLALLIRGPSDPQQREGRAPQSLKLI